MMDDLISREAALDALKRAEALTRAFGYHYVIDTIQELPSAQPEQTDCEYCHEDGDGYVTPLDKNCHAFIRFGMNGWEISLSAKGWNGSAKILYCPMCGRELKNG